MNSRRRGQSATRGQNLTTAEVIARYMDGPTSGVFTDGSCLGNPGPGGWGAVRVQNGQVVHERYGFEPATTNNRMELQAMITGLGFIELGETVDVYTDSKLVVGTLTKWAAVWKKRGWRRSAGPVKNLELVQTAYQLSQDRPGAHIHWIRAHDGSRWNEYADALAGAYMRDQV